MDELRRPFQLDDIRVQLDASVGIACSPADAQDPIELLRRADVAMYAAKAAGGGYVASDHAEDARRRRQLRLGEDLRDALKGDLICAFYQPQVSLSTGVVTGVEALVRWQHPELGLLTPDDFLPLVARKSLMPAPTEAMLRNTLHQLARWHAGGFFLTLAVNIDAAALLDVDLPRKLRELLRQSKVAPPDLTFEITEDSLLINREAATMALSQFRDIGVRVSVDDYGSAYSSLSYLKDLPIDELKIDRVFVTTLDTDERAAAIVRSTTELGHDLGLTVVAEGVETEMVRRRLAAMGCDCIQGYVICVPQPADQITLLLGELRSAS